MKVDIALNGQYVIKLTPEDEIEQSIISKMLDDRAVKVSPLKHENGPAMLISAEK